ncbi:MAG: hypothetical protein ABI647_06655 [Gemmatimonadota bacterium]
MLKLDVSLDDEVDLTFKLNVKIADVQKLTQKKFFTQFGLTMSVTRSGLAFSSSDGITPTQKAVTTDDQDLTFRLRFNFPAKQIGPRSVGIEKGDEVIIVGFYTSDNDGRSTSGESFDLATFTIKKT